MTRSIEKCNCSIIVCNEGRYSNGRVRVCGKIYRVWSVINSTRLDRSYDNFQSSVAGSISVPIYSFYNCYDYAIKCAEMACLLDEKYEPFIFETKRIEIIIERAKQSLKILFAKNSLTKNQRNKILKKKEENFHFPRNVHILQILNIFQNSPNDSFFRIKIPKNSLTSHRISFSSAKFQPTTIPHFPSKKASELSSTMLTLNSSGIQN